MIKRITDKSKQQHAEFLANIKKIQECQCDPWKPCGKCNKLILGKNYLKLVKLT